MKTTRKKLGNIAIGLLIPLILLILWEYFGRIGVIRQTILPRPTLLLKKLTPILENGTLIKNLSASLYRVLIGYFAGAALGMILGIILGFFPFARKLSAIMIGVFRPIPALACIPILILLFGIGELSKIVVIMIGSF